MKLTCFDEHAFKRAAKLLCQLGHGKSLSSCLELLAQAGQYRDFYEVRQLLDGVAFARTAATLSQQVDVVSALGGSLGANPGDILDILYRTRFFGQATFDPIAAIDVRAGLFERMQFPQANLKSQGLVVKIRIKGRQPVRAILLEEGSPTKVMYDHTVGLIGNGGFQRSATPTNFFIPLRFYAVYGFWDEVDGSKVLFSRDYCPLWKVVEGKAPVRDDPFRRVNYRTQTIFERWWPADGDVAVTRAKSAEVLRNFKVQSVPRLVEHLPELIASKQWISNIKYERTFA